LEQLLPDVRFGVGHGQMNEHELEHVMSQFLLGEIDVLVCTTIIESGLDIPNANTIIIDRADRFGLAALYQLRGRVGRWSRQAFAYFLIPQQHILTTDARKRIAAIRRYTQLGAGFRLAVRDLEIRGTGNLLGSEQSGYINTIGFELYCQILRDTAKALKGEQEKPLKDVDMNIEFVKFGYQTVDETILVAGISPDYIECAVTRVAYYQRILTCRSLVEFDDIADEIRDRFGEFSEPLNNLFALYKLKLTLALHDYDSLEILNGRIYLKKDKSLLRDAEKQIPRLPDFLDTPAEELSYLIRWCEKIISL
jgi:transcription-repair coupling factor (superfamily II helicase)